MNHLYLTADAVGTQTGGGVVTYNESRALQEHGPCEVWSFPDAERPWGADQLALQRLHEYRAFAPPICHIYSGTFSDTVDELRSRGTRVIYTCAAHDVNVSREEHEKLGAPFDYPHLTDPGLFARYVRGYVRADLVVTPSAYSEKIVRGYGCRNVTVVPHGVDLPREVRPAPKRFSVSYLGQPGADKGLIYLVKAWDLLRYRDAMLTIAGRNTEHLVPLVREHGRNSLVYLQGWVRDVSDVYNACSLYVQPSASEGFGIEVLEALAHGRPALCSDGAGAAEFATHVVPARDPEALANAIEFCRSYPMKYSEHELREQARRCSWERVREMYNEVYG